MRNDQELGPLLGMVANDQEVNIHRLKYRVQRTH